MATTTRRVKKTLEKEPVAKQEKTEAALSAQEDAPVRETAHQDPEEKVTYRAKRDLDPNMYVTVKNGFNGVLVYKSRRTGERFVWQEFGDEQDMELMELKSARNASKDYFINNWFLFDDPAVIEWLGVGRYYKHALNTKSFDELFFKEPDEIKATMAELSKGQKRSVAFRAKQLIDEGTIDSIKTINALESCLGVELIER